MSSSASSSCTCCRKASTASVTEIMKTTSATPALGRCAGCLAQIGPTPRLPPAINGATDHVWCPTYRVQNPTLGLFDQRSSMHDVNVPLAHNGRQQERLSRRLRPQTAFDVADQEVGITGGILFVAPRCLGQGAADMLPTHTGTSCIMRWTQATLFAPGAPRSVAVSPFRFSTTSIKSSRDAAGGTCVVVRVRTRLCVRLRRRARWSGAVVQIAVAGERRHLRFPRDERLD